MWTSLNWIPSGPSGYPLDHLEVSLVHQDRQKECPGRPGGMQLDQIVSRGYLGGPEAYIVS